MQIPTYRRRRLASLFGMPVAVAGLVLGALTAAPPATAAGSVTLIGVQPTGQVGVTQALTVQAYGVGSCGSQQTAPTATISATPPGGALQTIGTATYSGCLGSGMGAGFQYTFQWTPTLGSTWYLNATVNGVNSATAPSTIAAVPTTTTISAPATVQLGVPTTLSATVTANNGGIFSAQGTIQFSVLGGGNIGSPVSLNTSVPSTATTQWVPATLGGSTLIATYTPANNGSSIQATTCGSSCTSTPDPVQVTSSGVNMYLANPPSFFVGTPSTITAVVSVVPPSGTVTFTANGAAIATNVPVQSNGYATTTWTPAAPGNYTLGATWAGAGNLTGTAQDPISVGATAPQADQIIVVGANGTTLTPGATYDTPNGTVITFTSRTASGAPVTFTETGPCTITSTTFTANQGNGQCQVTATSPGGNGYGPASASVTTILVPGTQTAKLAAPASGNINVGKTVTLEKPNQGKTNAKQTISWKITSGKGSICKLTFPSDGSVKLKMLKKGTCKVQANAKAVSGQWNAYQQNWKYKGV